ncbi:TPA: hypothetical protein H1009_04055 [archaeon]|nr:hypothetical protein [Candidatus Naiadarchaeales archaeon SRR2090153.bin461]
MKKLAVLPAVMFLASGIASAAEPFYGSGTAWKDVWNIIFNIASLNWLPEGAGNYAAVTRIIVFLFVLTIASGVFKALSAVSGGASSRSLAWVGGRTGKVLALLIAAVSALYMPNDVLIAIGQQWGGIGTIAMLFPIIGLLLWGSMSIESKWAVAPVVMLIALTGWLESVYASNPQINMWLMPLFPLIIGGLVIYAVYVLLKR